MINGFHHVAYFMIGFDDAPAGRSGTAGGPMNVKLPLRPGVRGSNRFVWFYLSAGVVMGDTRIRKWFGIMDA